MANAQFIKNKSILAQVGYGISTPYDSMDDIADAGFLAQGELVLEITSWFELRPYAGFVITSSNGDDLNGDPTNEKAELTAFLIGGKTRLRAPIPYVALYIELGLGASVGNFETSTAFDMVDKSGIIQHIPFGFGLELGKNHLITIGFNYYDHPAAMLITGAFTFGVTFPLDKASN